MIAGLIQFSLHLGQISNFAIGKSLSITEPPPYFTVGMIQGVAALSPTLRRTYTPLFNSKISNFDLSVQRILFHCSIVQYLCTLVDWNLLTLFCFLNSGFLIVVLPKRSYLLSSPYGWYWHIFLDIGSVVQWCLEQSILLSRKIVTDELIICIGKTGCIK